MMAEVTLPMHKRTVMERFMASFRCLGCGTTRPYGFKVPMDPLYLPWLSCGSCREPRRHIFVGLLFYRLQVNAEQERVRVSFTPVLPGGSNGNQS